MLKFGKCPQCTCQMRIETLGCWRCGTKVNGTLSIPLLARLPAEHADFVEKFLASNGSLSLVQKELECSYPKVRRLMNESMSILKEEIESSIREKEQILEAMEQKKLSGQDAMRLLNSLIHGGT
jgi:hypothetical protein